MTFDDVLPAGGYYCVAYGDKPNSTVFAASLAEFKSEIAKPWPGQVWYAHAAFIAPDRRQKVNVRAHKSLVFDIDTWAGTDAAERAAKEAKGYRMYDDQASAWNAFTALVQAAQIPIPSYAVDSGNGIHVYWVLDREVDPATWTRLTSPLKARLRRLDPALAWDTSRVADSAGLLRWPGTVNTKNGAYRPVKIVKDTQRIVPVAEFEAIAATEVAPMAAPNAAAIPPILAGPVPQHILKRRLAGGRRLTLVPASLKDPSPMLENCGALKTYRDKLQTTVGRSAWIAVLQLAAYIDDGLDYAHEISRGHPTYTAAAVERAYDDAVRYKTVNNQAPRTCANLLHELKLDPKVTCAGCVFHGRPHASPVNLPRPTPAPAAAVDGTWASFEAAVAEVMAVEHAVPDWLDHSGQGFFISADSTLCYRGRRSDADPQQDDGPSDEDPGSVLKVADATPWVVRRTDTHLTYAVARHGSNGVRTIPEYDVRIGKVSNPKTFRQEMADTCGVRFKESQVLIKRYWELLGDHEPMASREARKQYGWDHVTDGSGTGFTVGRLRIEASSLQPSSIAGDARAESVQRRMGHKGSIASWREAANLWMQHGSDEARFGLMLAFATPLMVLTREPTALCHVYGGSGTGKSSLFRMISSVWGKPEKTSAKADDTQRSIDNILGVAGNLPAMIDEITEWTEKRIAELAFSFEKGEIGNAREGSTGTIRLVSPSWRTIAFTNANRSVVHATYNATADTAVAEAKAMRIFELEMPSERPSIATDLTHDGEPVTSIINRTIEDNYGMVGPYYAQYLVANRDSVRDRVLAAIASGRGQSRERFWDALIASAKVASEIVIEIGLIDMNITMIDRIAIGLRRQQEDRIRGVESARTEPLIGYIQNHQSRTWLGSTNGSYVMRDPNATNTTDVEIVLWGFAPNANSPIEYMVPVDRFAVYCTNRKIDASAAIDRAAARGILTPNGGSKVWTFTPPGAGRVATQAYKVIVPAAVSLPSVAPAASTPPANVVPLRTGGKP